MKKYLIPILISFAVALSTVLLITPLLKNQFLGAGKTVQTYKPVIATDGTVATSSQFIGDVIPENNNNEDLGQYGNAWRDIYASGTLYGGTFSGMMSFNTDSGLLDAIDIPVSSAAATTTKEGYVFSVDGLSTLQILGSSDALGSVYNRRVSMTDSIGTATTTFQIPSNSATTTFYFGAKDSTNKGQGTCLVLTGGDGIRYYISVTSTGAVQASTVDCTNSGLGLTRD